MKIKYKKRSVTQSEYVVKYEQKYKKKIKSIFKGSSFNFFDFYVKKSYLRDSEICTAILREKRGNRIE